ncbi:MAG: hypothetical protein IJW64_00895 [Clostridia bacterium]|nr:hypothetical protein [Clostridia bacterium]
MLNPRDCKFDIIILGGQSNAEGCGRGPVSNEFEPNDSILYMFDKRLMTLDDNGLHIVGCADHPFVVETAKERFDGDFLGDFSLTFADSYLKKGYLKGDRKLLIIRSALGGAGFQKGNWGLYDYLYLRLLAMLELALSWNKENEVVAFLWHQGEHDAFERNIPSRYERQLTDLLKGVRQKAGVEMPFIAGDFVQDWKSKNLESCNPIVDVIRKVTVDNARCGFVESVGLKSNDQTIANGDDIQFSRENFHLLGLI